MTRSVTILCAALLLSLVRLAAQYPPDPAAAGEISGTVVNDRTNLAMPRVQVILEPVSNDEAPAAATTLTDGRFSFPDLVSGYYSLQALHAGFLPSSFAETEHTRLPYVFGLMPGERLEGIVIRLHPAGVISGKVEFSDGAPAIDVPVEFYREYFFRGRHGFQRAGTAPTDDRGAYRVYGLAPGRYYIVAAYSPPAPARGMREQRPLDENGRALPDNDFVTTYYPSTDRLIEAMPVSLRPGEELSNTNILLSRAPTSRIRGRVISGETGEILGGADLRLRQPSPVADVLVDVPVPVLPQRDGSFEITGVTPGAYTLRVFAVEDGVQLTGRVPVSVSGADADNIEITLSPYQQLTGRVVPEEGTATDESLSLFRVALEPHSDATPGSSVSVSDSGEFALPYVPGETYDVFLLDGPPGAYLVSARIGGFDVIRTGFRAERGALPPMELEFSLRGAVISGEIADTSTRVALGATVVLVPEPAFGRVQYYQTTTTDAYGLYRFEGVAPGRYTIASWWDDPPCEVYDLESLDACREVGQSVEVRAGEPRMVNLPLAKRP